MLSRIIVRNVGGTPTYVEYTDYRLAAAQAGSFVASDHGLLSGLNDDDHPQYLTADGQRELTGDLQFGPIAIFSADGTFSGFGVQADDYLNIPEAERFGGAVQGDIKINGN